VGAAAISGVALVLLILGVIAAVIIILAVLATTTGIFLYKRAHDVSAHAFEGELVSGKSVPVGSEVEAPEWALESGGDGVNPMGNNRDLSRVQSFFSGLKSTFSSANMTRTFSTAAMRPSPLMEVTPEVTEMVRTVHSAEGLKISSQLEGV
jgi:hypothetical protein